MREELREEEESGVRKGERKRARRKRELRE